VSVLELKFYKFAVHKRAVCSVRGLDGLALFVECRRRPLFGVCGVWQECVEMCGQLKTAEVVDQVPENYGVRKTERCVGEELQVVEGQCLQFFAQHQRT
jgi:hypothetical protein